MRVCHFATRPSDAEQVNTLLAAVGTFAGSHPALHTLHLLRGCCRARVTDGTCVKRATNDGRTTIDPQSPAGDPTERSNRPHRWASPLRSIVEGVVDGLRPDAGPVPGSASVRTINQPDSSRDDITANDPEQSATP